MLFFPTKNINEILKRNLNKRMGNISKFYAWLDVNTDTPVEVKLMVLYNCMFSAILYGVETWGDISYIEDLLLSIELTALKAILKVKSGTTNDLVLHELRRCNIIARIKDRQYVFYKKILELPPGNAVVKETLEICKDSKMITYYSKLKRDNSSADINAREKRIYESLSSMCIYYRQFNFRYKSCIYSSFLNDYYRFIITRWRISNHDLKIETGRYTKPYTPRENRICELCDDIENEYHVIFNCPLYNSVRKSYPNLVAANNISEFLNPDFNKMKDTALFLHEIEKVRKKGI